MVSILLPTHNGERFIEQSIDSILNQTYKDFEILIGINCTSDSTMILLEKYRDRRLKIYSFEDKGKSRTLNKLLHECKYDLIALQDDDDIWITNKLEKQIEHIQSFDIIGGFIKYINEEGLGESIPELAIYDLDIKSRSFSGVNQVANTTTLFNKKDVLKIGGWREDIDGIEDFDLWLRLMRQGKRFYNVPEVLVHHRLHNNSKFNTQRHDLSKILFV